MLLLKWLRTAIRQRSGPSSKPGTRKLASPQMGTMDVSDHFTGNDPYWWILAGGIHVPGFGAYPGPDPGDATDTLPGQPGKD